MKVSELVLTLTATLKKHPELLDLPVYAVNSSSGAMYTDVSICDSHIDKSDIEMSDLSWDDMGKPYLCIVLD